MISYSYLRLCTEEDGLVYDMYGVVGVGDVLLGLSVRDVLVVVFVVVCRRVCWELGVETGWGCTAVVSMAIVIMVSRVDLFMFCTLIFINIMIILH